MEGERDGATSLVRITEHAMEQFRAMSGMEPEKLTGARRESDGWSLLVDVVEQERVPTTMSVLASYRIDTDQTGEVIGFERLRRFTRVTTD